MAIEGRDQRECDLRYGGSRANQSRGRLGVCQLQLQRVNTQTSCQSRLRHSKQSEDSRVNAIIHEFAHLCSAESSWQYSAKAFRSWRQKTRGSLEGEQ